MSEKTVLVENQLKNYVDYDSDFSFDATYIINELEAKKVDVEEIKAKEIGNFTYMGVKETVNILCDLFFKIFFVCYGILQFFAISSGLFRIFHEQSIFTLLISSLLAFLPVIGGLFGVWGACTGWGWNISNCIFIFTIPYLFVNAPMLMITFFETYKDTKRWRMEKQILKNQQKLEVKGLIYE